MMHSRYPCALSPSDGCRPRLAVRLASSDGAPSLPPISLIPRRRRQAPPLNSRWTPNHLREFISKDEQQASTSSPSSDDSSPSDDRRRARPGPPRTPSPRRDSQEPRARSRDAFPPTASGRQVPNGVRHLPRFQVVIQLLRIEQEGAFASLARGSPSPSGGDADDWSDLTPREERQVTELVSNVTRWRRRLDYTISELARMSAADLDPAMRQVLRVAIYELTREEHALPPHVISEHVEIAKAMVHDGAGSFANGVLRAATRRMALGTLPFPPVDDSGGASRALARQLAICHSHPTWMVVRWMRRFEPLGAVQLMQHYNLGRPTYSVRVNSAWSLVADRVSGDNTSENGDGRDRRDAPAGTDAAAAVEEGGTAPGGTAAGGAAVGGRASGAAVAALLEELSEAGVDASPSPYLPDAFVRVREGLQTLLTQGFVSSGRCSIQDESAGLVVALLDPRPGETILDACAAPGGKTLYAAMRLKGQGRVTAVDVSAPRVAALERAVRASGLGSVVTTVVAGLAEFADESVAAGRRWDRVLVDAPCSGTGVLGKRADMRWRRSAEDLVELTALQDTLLDAAARLVVPGGVLVYSTCSIEKEEDEDRVAAFLLRHPAWRVEAPLAQDADGNIATLSGESVAPSAGQGAGPGLPVLPADVLTPEGFLATLPHLHGTDGAFAARLRAPLKEAGAGGAVTGAVGEALQL